MPPSFTVVTQGSERLVHVHERDRTSSGGSASARSPASSGGSRSFSSEESWSEVEYEDDIEPSDSASRSRQPATRRHTVEARAAPTSRHSSHRNLDRDDEAPARRHSSRRHHSSRHSSRHDRHDSHSRAGRSSSRRVRVPSDESSSTVASADDYPQYGHPGAPRSAYPPMPPYRHPQQNPAGYPPSMASAGGYPDPYGHPQSALVHMRQDPFGYPQPQGNPFAPNAPPQQNPFSPMSSNESSAYFATDPMGPPPPRHRRPDAPPRPQSFVAPSQFGSELMAYHSAMPGYPPYGMPGYHPYPPIPGWPPSAGSSPPPKEKPSDRSAEIEAIKAQFEELINKRDAADADLKQKKEKNAEIESLKDLIRKHQEEAVAQQKAWVAEREAEAAARAAEKARAEEEARRKQEIDEARKKAKEDAEKVAGDAAQKAKEEHEKKLAEATQAKEEADKAKKALEDEIAKNKPTADELKPPIKFKDAVGRKFSFPWRLCKSWKGMEALIKQAFLHVDVIGDHVHQGHYDLTGPDGEIILPQVWDTMVQPDWEITMHLWPMEEEKKHEPDPMMGLHDSFANLGLGGMGGMGGGFHGLGDLGMLPPEHKKKPGKKDSGKKKKGSPETMMAHPMLPPGPPPMGYGPPPGPYGDPFAGLGAFGLPGPPPGKKDKPKAKGKTKASKELSPLQAWFAGGSLNAKSSKKR